MGLRERRRVRLDYPRANAVPWEMCLTYQLGPGASHRHDHPSPTLRRVDEGYWRQGNSEYVQPVKRRRRPRLRKLRGPREESASSGEDVGGEHDDADEANFDARQAARARRRDRGAAEEGGSGSEAEPEEDALVEFEGGFRISAGVVRCGVARWRGRKGTGAQEAARLMRQGLGLRGHQPHPHAPSPLFS